MLKNKNIEVRLNADFYKVKEGLKYRKLIFTGEIDKFFNYKHGKLEYRCINFDFQAFSVSSYQKNSVINYVDKDVDFTRITEFKKFNLARNKKTIICKEYPGWQGEPGYPVPTQKNFKILKKYLQDAKKMKDVYFLGRMGNFKYINMDQAVKESLALFNKISSEVL
jgi:UDP-galactopyranose mutase